jgi:aspartyl/asparaginyl beta-hydroxylase (cupin superfamily)
MGIEPSSLDALAAEARAASRAGRAGEAAERWRRIVAAAPDHAEALLSLGQYELRRGAAQASLEFLARAERATPKEAMVPLEAALAHRMLGDGPSEIAALDRALAADPYCFPALLFKGAALERLGHPRNAAAIYTNALKILPAEERIAPSLMPAVARARALVAEEAKALDAYLEQRLAGLRRKHADERLDRFEECKDAAVGKKKIYVHEPTLLNVPRLPAIQYFDDDLFPWMAELEAATDDIAAELVALVEGREAGFVPYVRFRPGEPVNQWTELNHSPKWSAYFFYENGALVAEHAARCPKTAAALARIPQAVTPGYSPNAFFSTLAPGAHIPPHTGSTNARLIGHLPLIVPEGCAFRVGNETRDWRRGKAWVFDDTIEHEAWNRSDKLRVILIFDIWNPLLTAAETELISELLVARRDYGAGG